MRKVKEIIQFEDFTMDEFWEVVNALSDEGEGKKHKDNINKYFKKDGSLKAKALSPISQDDYQSIQDTENFVSTSVANQIHLNKIRNHVLIHKEHIQNLRSDDPEIRKEARKYKVTRFGKLKKHKRYEDEE